MKKSLLTLLAIFLFSSISFSQSFRIGPSFGLNKAQEFSITTIGSDLEIDFDNEVHYGLKAKLDLPTLSIAASLHKMTFKKGAYERDFLSIAVGPEFKLIPGPITPYFGAELLFTSYNTTIGIPNSFENDAIGLGFGAGIDLKIFPKIDVDVSLKYKLNNLIGSEDNEDSFNTISFSAAILFSIL